METLFEIEFNHQTLYEGSWDDENADWDWTLTVEKFKTESAARKVFNTLKVSADTPIIRLYRTTYDEYGCTESEELLAELF